MFAYMLCVTPNRCLPPTAFIRSALSNFVLQQPESPATFRLAAGLSSEVPCRKFRALNFGGWLVVGYTVGHRADLDCDLRCILSQPDRNGTAGILTSGGSGLPRLLLIIPIISFPSSRRSRSMPKPVTC